MLTRCYYYSFFFFSSYTLSFFFFFISILLFYLSFFQKTMPAILLFPAIFLPSFSLKKKKAVHYIYLYAVYYMFLHKLTFFFIKNITTSFDFFFFLDDTHLLLFTLFPYNFFFFNKISIVSGVLSLILQTQSNLSFLLLSAGSSEVLQQSLYFYNWAFFSQIFNFYFLSFLFSFSLIIFFIKKKNSQL